MEKAVVHQHNLRMGSAWKMGRRSSHKNHPIFLFGIRSGGRCRPPRGAAKGPGTLSHRKLPGKQSDVGVVDGAVTSIESGVRHIDREPQGAAGKGRSVGEGRQGGDPVVRVVTVAAATAASARRAHKNPSKENLVTHGSHSILCLWGKRGAVQCCTQPSPRLIALCQPASRSSRGAGSMEGRKAASSRQSCRSSSVSRQKSTANPAR